MALLEWIGRYAKWVLPLGLVAGFVLPQAAQPLKSLIAPCIALLLFLAVLRILRSAQTHEHFDVRVDGSLLLRVLAAQVLLPLIVFGVASILGVPLLWTLAMTLVAAAPPISGSPSLVMLMRGDASLALRWLVLATVLLPLSCLPILFLLFPDQPLLIMLLPSVKLLLLIAGAILMACVTHQVLKRIKLTVSPLALDGAAALTLAIMVVGLMSAIHAPDTRWSSFVLALLIAIAINAGFQCVGVLSAYLLKLSSPRAITTGVVYGNRNIALYLTALPASSVEPLLLFIACYQIPMYLTPLVGDFFYRRLE